MTSKLYSRNMHFIHAMGYNFNTNKDFTRYWEMVLNKIKSTSWTNSKNKNM